MEDEEKFGTLKLLLLMAGLIIAIPYWLFKTIFNTELDFGTRLSYVLMSIPSALLLFFVVTVFGTMAVLFIPVYLCSDAWPVGVFAIICVVCVGYRLIKVIASRNKKG